MSGAIWLIWAVGITRVLNREQTPAWRWHFWKIKLSNLSPRCDLFQRPPFATIRLFITQLEAVPAHRNYSKLLNIFNSSWWFGEGEPLHFAQFFCSSLSLYFRQGGRYYKIIHQKLAFRGDKQVLKAMTAFLIWLIPLCFTFKALMFAARSFILALYYLLIKIVVL